jgi:membrane-associated phospholipid phosphatase
MKNKMPILLQRYKFNLIVCLILILLSNAAAQNKYNFNQFADEAVELFKRPVKWNGGDWAILGGIAAGTFLTMQFDESVQSIMLKDRNYVNSIPLQFGKYYGEPITPILIGGVLYTLGYANDNEANKQLGFEILEASAFSFFVTSLVKLSFGRARPSAGTDAFDFSPFSSIDDEHLSLSSGHTSLAFSMSTVLAQHTASNVMKILYYVPAFVTAFSRVYHNRHWVSDTFAGAFVGYFVGRFVVDLHKKKDELDKPSPPPQMFSISFAF